MVHGRLIQDKKNIIIVKQTDQSKLIMHTYGKRQVDTRTIDTTRVWTVNYWQNLAEYFWGRTWDFRSDTDDFIQSIRCCENALDALPRDDDRYARQADEIEKKLHTITADYQRWQKLIEKRAAQQKLEADATLPQRLESTETGLEKNADRIETLADQLDSRTEDLTAEVSRVRKDIAIDLNRLSEQLNRNRYRINYLYRRGPNYYIVPGPPINSENNND